MRLSTEALLTELHRFQVLREDLVVWEQALGLSIPVDSGGKPVYSEHHLNLFKNIKKHVALGKSFADIQQLVQLPAGLAVAIATEASPPVARSVPTPNLQTVCPPVCSESPTPSMTTQPTSSASLMAPPEPPKGMTRTLTRSIPTVPNRPSSASLAVPQNDFLELLRQTMVEKDHLQQQLIETEKLNSHLNNANGMFHRKVKQLTEELRASQAAGDQNRLFQLMEDKARLHHQVLDGEKTIAQLKKQLLVSDELMQQSRQESAAIEQQRLKQIQFLQSELSSNDGLLLNPAVFCGHWNEEAYWLETRFDTYGVDIPADRQRVLSIVEPPAQLMGSMALLSQTYRLEQQPQWQRTETLVIQASSPLRLQGIMDVTYRLNETPVAQAWYRISATKQP